MYHQTIPSEHLIILYKCYYGEKRHIIVTIPYLHQATLL